MSNLTVDTARGAIWSLAENLGLRGVQLVFSVVLARLLLPEQFGLIGILSLFMALAQSLLDSGFGSALIQKKDATHLDFCSVFFLNLLIGVALTTLLWLSSPAIAAFFEEPQLIPLLKIVSLGLIVNAFCLVPRVNLQRRLDFRRIAIVSLTSVTISGIVAVLMAWMGYGVWSLAIQGVLTFLISAIMLWFVGYWRPSLLFSGESIRSLWTFGSRMLLSGVLNTIFSNLYQPIIGKLYTPADAGYYMRASSLQATAVAPATAALSRAMFPALSSIQDNSPRVKQGVRKALNTIMLFHVPVMVILIVIAPSLITLLFTDRWAASVPYFQVLCVAAILYPLHLVNVVVLQSVGRSDLVLHLQIIKTVLILGSIAIGIQWGVMGLVIGQVFTSVINLFLNGYYTGKLIEYGAMQQIGDALPIILLSLIMGVGMYFVGQAVSNQLVSMFAQTAAGMMIYAGLIYTTRKEEFLGIIRLARLAAHL